MISVAMFTMFNRPKPLFFASTSAPQHASVSAVSCCRGCSLCLSLVHIEWIAWAAYLQNTKPLLMKNVPFTIPKDTWFQHDETRLHFTLGVRAHVNNMYGERGIHCVASTIAQLNFLWFFSLGICEGCDVRQPVDTIEEVIVQIRTAFHQREFDSQCYNRVMNAMWFSVDTLNIYCKWCRNFARSIIP